MKSNNRQDQERPTLRYRRLAVIVLILLGGWLFTSYLLVSHFTDKRLETTLHRYSTELKQTTEAVTYHFERSVSFLHVVPGYKCFAHCGTNRGGLLYAFFVSCGEAAE